MGELFVFAGTTEGRDFIREFLKRAKKETWQIHVFTATEYGGELAQASAEAGTLEIHTGRLDEAGIFQALSRHKPEYAVDCTHPHAREVTQNLESACARAGCKYLRFRRGGVEKLPAGVKQVDSLQEAADFLLNRDGNILLTTGTKALAPFAAPELRDRVFVRVLPLEESVRICKVLGFPVKNILGMQGPFSEEMNRVLLREIQARWLVTKDSGTEGGLEEKLSAADREGVGLLLIRRPAEPEALGLEEILRIIFQDPGEIRRAENSGRKIVYLIGVGCGGEACLTSEAIQAIRQSRSIIGSPRLLADLEKMLAGKPRYALTGGTELAESMARLEEPVGVLVSGDSGFYSGAKRLIPLLQGPGRDVRILPGVSSLSYFAAKLGLSWDDAKVVSLHGRTGNIIGSAAYHPKTFFLTGETRASDICDALQEAGLGNLTLHIGERLSYPDERITTGTAETLGGRDFDNLSVVMVENPGPRLRALGNYSLRDSAFTRGPIPMTKEEVRAVSLAKLNLEPASVAWDIGAGTGSVACEMALRAWDGWVYAIEQNPDAVTLIEENRKNLGIFNLTGITGIAPPALQALPRPDRVFIGGSSGKLDSILEAVLAKNPQVRVVINGITLETLSAGLALLKKYAFEDTDMVQISVARAESAGNMHLMKALNPVFILSASHR
jgi:precorrin-6Y C5,15-methyltransferase (decarboxylating)